MSHVHLRLSKVKPSLTTWLSQSVPPPATCLLFPTHQVLHSTALHMLSQLTRSPSFPAWLENFSVCFKTHLPWQTFPDSALSLSPLACSCPGPHRSDWSPLHPVLPHTPLSVFYQNGGATERNFRLGMDHRGYLNLEGRQTTLGGKLSLFSCFRVLVYFISSSKYYAFYVWPLKLYSGSFVLLPPGSHTQQAGQSLI